MLDKINNWTEESSEDPLVKEKPAPRVVNVIQEEPKPVPVSNSKKVLLFAHSTPVAQPDSPKNEKKGTKHLNFSYAFRKSLFKKYKKDRN